MKTREIFGAACETRLGLPTPVLLALLLGALPLETGAQTPPGATRYETPVTGGPAGHVQFPHRPIFEYDPGAGALTIESWVRVERLEKVGNESAHPIVWNLTQGSSTGTGGWILALDRSGHVVLLTQKDGTGALFASDGTLQLGKWTHVAVTLLDGRGQIPARVRFFINGELDREHGGPGPIPLGSNPGPFRIGSPLPVGWTHAVCLDELRLWARELSGDDIRGGLHREVRGAQGLRAVFPDGGREEVTSGLRGSVTGRVSEDCPGIVRNRLDVPPVSSASGPPPTVDGFVGPGEYAPLPGVLTLVYGDGSVRRNGVAAFLHTTDDLHIGLDFTRLPVTSPAFPTIRFFFHTAGTALKSPGPADIAIVVPLDGQESWVEYGTGGKGFVPCDHLSRCPDGLWEAAVGAGVNGNAGGPSVEVRVSKQLLGQDPENLRVAIAHFGFAGLGDNPGNPAVEIAPGSAVWHQPSTWIPLRFVPPAPRGAGTCVEPIALPSFEPLPLVRTVSLVDAKDELSSSRCLQLAHPGPERYLRFTPPFPAVFRIAAYPTDPGDNIALWVGRSCPPGDGDCLGGSDEGGAGKPEVLEVEMDTVPHIIAIDGSFGPGGDSIGEVTLRIDVRNLAGELPGSATVVDVRGARPDELPAIQRVLLETWEVDAKDGRVLGVAADDAIRELGRRGFGVEAYGRRESDKVESGPHPERPTIRFDRFRYRLSASERAFLTLHTDPAGLPAVQKAYVVSEGTGDIESVSLDLVGCRYLTAQPLALAPGNTRPFDGVLGVEPGSVLVGLWQDPRRPGDLAGTAAGFAMLRGRKPLGVVDIKVDPGVRPPVDETPGRGPQESPRPLGALADGSGFQISLGIDQLVVRKDDPDLGDFLKRYDARVVDDGLAPGVTKNPHALVRFDPGKVDIGDAEAVLELAGMQGVVRISDESLMPLLVLIAEERLRGHAIEPSVVLEYHAQPRTSDGGGLNVFQEPFATDCLQGLQRAWLYTSIFDREVADGLTPVRVALVDSNFCPGIADEATVVGGYDFFNDVDSPFGRASVLGGEGGEFHGTPMASIVGGHLDNGVGAAGSGGLVSELLLYNIGGVAYLFDGARAIRRAVTDGARVVNMSWGFPCAIAGIDFCNPAVGTFLCLVLGPILDTALVIASPFLPLPPGSGGPTCFYLASFLAGARGALASAAEDAERAGVVLVASAGNARDITGQGTVEQYGIIPASLPNVVAVGVVDGTGGAYANTQFHGSAVDVWVLEQPPHFLPSSSGDCPPFSVQYFPGTSGGTAYVSGVIAMMRAVNPSLSPARIRAILAASTVDTPGTDPRVRRFLRSDLAVMTAGSRPVGVFPAPSTFTSGLAFDERDASMPGVYGPTGGCLDAWGSPWPPVLRDSNDAPPSAAPIPLLLEGDWRGEGFGLHRFGTGDGGDADFYRLPARPGGDACETRNVSITVEYPRAAGAMRPEVPGFEGRLSTSDVGDLSRTTWTGRRLFVNAPLIFQVAGSDNLYDLEVSVESAGSFPPDRFEDNDTIEDAAPFAGSEFARHRDPDFIERSLRVAGLSFHCPDDTDFFRIELPSETEDCRDPEDACGIGDIGALTQLFVSAAGARLIRLYDPAGERVVESGSVIRMRCPRSMGYSTLILEVLGDGRRYTSYDLSVRYWVPSEIADTDAIEDALNEWLCCELSEGRPCSPDSRPRPGWGGPDSIGIDLWSPWLQAPRLIHFSAFCPAEVCDPAPAQYHRIGWPGEATLDMQVEAPAAARDRLAGELLDSAAEVVGIVGPMFLPQGAAALGGGGAGGVLPGGLVWDLTVPDLPAGDYFLRIRGLEAGEVYALSNVNPLPLPVAPRAPTDLVVTGSTSTTIEISWKDSSSDEILFGVERLDPGAGRYVSVARLPAETTLYTDRGLEPDTEYSYRVRALGVGGPSGYSNEATGRTARESDLVAFHRGDADGSGVLDITDSVVILGYLFLGGRAPACLDAADANDDGKVDISDAIVVLGYLFLGSPPPADPGPPGFPCREDPTPEDGVACETYESCQEEKQ